MKLGRLLGALALTGILSCFSDPAGPAGKPMQTDRAAYVARHVADEGRYGQSYAFTVAVLFDNVTGETVYLGRCSPDSPAPMYDVELIGGTNRWGSAYSPAWACTGHDRQFILQPGETHTERLRLTGPYLRDGHTGEPMGAFEGHMRLRYDVRYCPDSCAAKAADSLSRSNVFEVRLES